MRLPRSLGAALVFLAALAYLLLFFRHGFFIQDEGVLTYQALRVHDGQRPYADFQTAYTPAVFYLHAWLFDAFGPSLLALRAAGAVACAVTAAFLFLAAARVLPAPWAYLPSLLYVVLEDQDSSGFVVHTLAYPARYVETLWAISLWLTLVYVRRPPGPLGAALGMLAAAIAAFKHNVGIYNAWAVGLSLVLAAHVRASDEVRPGRGLLALLPFGFVLAVFATLPVLFGGFGSSGRAILLFVVLPIAALLVILLPGAWPWGASEHRRHALRETGADLCWFAGGALVPTAAWVAWFLHTVGPAVLLQRIVHEGAAAARIYAIALPRPGGLALGVGGFFAVVLVLRGLVRRRQLDVRAAVRGLGAATGVLAAAGLVATGRVVLQTIRMGQWDLAIAHFGRHVDNLAFYVATAIAYGFLPRLLAWRRSHRGVDLALVCWIHGLCQLLLAYPRLDPAHLYQGVVILLVPGTVLLHATLRFYRRLAPSRTPWLSAAAITAVTLVVALKVAPRLDTQLRWHGGLTLEPRTVLAGPRGGLIGTDAEGLPHFGGWLAAVNRVVARIEASTHPGDPVFAYPALAGLYFLSGRPNPSGMDYWFKGFGEGRDEAATITALEQARVPLVVRMTDYSWDPEEEGHFPTLKDYLRRHFVQTAVIGPFKILERVTSPVPLFPAQIDNGDFAAGTLRGFAARGIRSGATTIVRQGAEFAGPGSADIPFPNGPATHAALLRSAGDGRPGSVAVLTSVPFAPQGPDLELDTLSESAAVRLEVVFFDPDGAGVQGRVRLPVERAAPGAAAQFRHVTAPFPGGPGHPVRVEIQQETQEPRLGWFTLVTNLTAGEGGREPDRDGDGVADAIDDCPAVADPDQTNSDGDRPGDACDNCPYTQNNDQADRDGDGVGNRCATDLDGDGYTDEADIARIGAAVGRAGVQSADLDNDGRVDVADLALFARELRVGVASDDLWDFTEAFVDHQVRDGLGFVVPLGTVMSSLPDSDLVAFPGPFAVAVRSGIRGNPASEGVLTTRPFVPTGPRLRLAVLSEDAAVAATVRVLRPGPNPRRPAPEDILVEAAVRNDRPGTGPSAAFEEQVLDIGPWFDAARPLRSPRIQVQVRQHTTRRGYGYFTLIGDLRTGP